MKNLLLSISIISTLSTTCAYAGAREDLEAELGAYPHALATAHHAIAYNYAIDWSQVNFREQMEAMMLSHSFSKFLNKMAAESNESEFFLIKAAEHAMAFGTAFANANDPKRSSAKAEVHNDTGNDFDSYEPSSKRR